MKEFSVYNKRLAKKVPDLSSRFDDDVKIISYSQFSTYHKCPKAWELKYIKKEKDIAQESIHFVFGTAFHETVQYMLYLAYNKTVKEAIAMDYSEFMLDRMRKDYEKRMKKADEPFTTPEEMAEFYLDGIEIIKSIMKKRTVYFSTRQIELVGIEIPIFYEVRSCTNKSIRLLCYLDLVFRDKRDNEFLITDLKTSTKGWSKWDKKDFLKTNQLVLYKEYFSKQYGIDVDKIKINYFIVRRKIDENSEWPQKRIQEFTPTSGSISRKKILKKFTDFFTTVFNEDGSYNTDIEYIANQGNKGFNCTFCPYNKREDLCPTSKRVVCTRD